MREHVDVLVDRSADEETTVLAVVRGKVRATAPKAHAQRRLREYDAHATTRSSSTNGCSSSQSSVRAMASRIETLGCQPSARILLVSSRINGLSPGQPRIAARIFDLRRDAEMSRRSSRSTRRRQSSHPFRGCRCERRPAREALRSDEHRGYAVADVEIRLLLSAVAEYLEPRRVLSKAAEEVEDVTVRVPLTKDRHEPKDHPREAVARGSRPGSSPRRQAWRRRRARSESETDSSPA